jgi:hypothetical protein
MDAGFDFLYIGNMRHSDEYIRRRLLSRSAVDSGTGCREWLRARHGQGYGRLWDGDRLQYAHRLSYEVFVGAVPAGLGVLHWCDNPGCIEPLHLWCGTVAENMADRDAKGRGGGWKNAGRGRSSGARGSLHPLSKLTEERARELKARLRRDGGRIKIAPLAREFGVSASLLYGIRDGRNWGWL